MPRLRRLRGAVRGAAVHARAGNPARADRVRHRHRLRGAVRLLHGHVRDARHPRPRAGARHRPGGSRDDLSIWVVTGDGDSLSIGGNHLIHALRRNVPIKILLFNNQIYGLTKGQASPTSELGKVTKSTPFGVADHPFNPVALALGAEATFVARTIDRDRQHLTEMLRAAASHEGAALVEIYQNCPVFNDGAFAALTEKGHQGRQPDPARAGQADPVRRRGERGIARARDGSLEIVDVAEVGEDALVVHDPRAADPGLAFSLARLAEDPTGPTPIGIFREVERPVFRRARAERSRPPKTSWASCCSQKTPGRSPKRRLRSLRAAARRSPFPRSG